jgi:DNA polymerase III delta prime subunit
MMNHSIIKIENISNYTIEIIDDILIATKKGKTKKEYTEWTEELLLEKDIKNSSLSYCKLNDVVFKPKKWRLLVDKLYDIMDKEEIDLDDSILDKIVDKSHGDLRKSINMLQCLTTFSKISKNNDISLLFNMIELSDIDLILTELKSKNDFISKFNKIKKLIDEKEYNMTDVIQYLINLLIEKKDINKRIIKELSKLELKTYNNLDSDLIICSLIGTFILLK